jgi:hypothetical protein
LRIGLENALGEFSLLLGENSKVIVKMKDSGRSFHFLSRCVRFIEAGVAVPR